MFPILAVVYARLARSEEREVEALFGLQWTAYVTQVDRYLPTSPTRAATGPTSRE